MSKKIRVGTVIANKVPGMVTVAVNSMKSHPLYHKSYRVTKKYHADTAGATYEIGQEVTIEETKPISKTKYWKVTSTGSDHQEG